MENNVVSSKSQIPSEVSRSFDIICAGKPCICFNKSLKIIDCNSTFLDFFKTSTNEVFEIDIQSKKVNSDFIAALHDATSTGTGIYQGMIDFGFSEKPSYIEVVFFSTDQLKTNEKITVCQIIKSVNEQQIKLDSHHFKPESDNVMQNNLHTSVSVHSIDGKALYVSPLIESLLGYSREELANMGPVDPVFPEDVHIVLDAVNKLSGGSEYVNSKYRMVRKDNTVIHVESSSYLISDANGSNRQIVNVTFDQSYQNKIERELHLSEQKYFRLLMKMPSGISLLDKHGRVIEMNAAFREIMGIPFEADLAEFRFFDNPGMINAGIAQQLHNCIDTKGIVEGEIRVERKTEREAERKEQYLVYSFLPVFDLEGEIDTVVAYVYDNTDQKRAEIEIRGRVEFLNLVINTIKSPLFVKDEKHQWVILNDAAVEMMGFKREELIGKSDYDLYPKEQADVFWRYDELVFKNGSTVNEEQITWSDGSNHTVVTNKQLYTEESTGNKFIVGTIHDISNYKKIEESLRESEQNYHELFDNSRDYIVITDLEGNIEQANRTFLEHLQMDNEILKQHNVNEFIINNKPDFWQDSVAKLLAGKLENSIDIEIVSFKGEFITYEIKPSIIRSHNAPLGIQCILSDVTQARLAQKKLEQYNKELQELNETKDKFFSIIAHDLRNPYNSQIGFAELLLEDLENLSKDEIRESLKIIRNSAKNSYNLLENLLAWSRLETGRMPFNPEKINLLKFVDEVVNVLYSLAYRKKIKIFNTIDSNILLFADSNMFTSIINNLVMNAIKYTAIGGEISVYCENDSQEIGQAAHFIKVSVADTGIGMEEEFVKNLFSGGKPVSSPGTSKEPGTGLGLLLVREMVEKHGGKITVESKLNKGSIFSFTVPVFK